MFNFIKSLNLSVIRNFSLKIGIIEAAIRSNLEDKFKPIHIEVINESHLHNVPKGSETHFRVVIVCKEFAQLNSLNRHRLVNEVLKDQLRQSVHALAIETYSPDQWTESSCSKKSPTCKGGAGL